MRSKVMEVGLKWVRMARYELILRLDGALWLRIILKHLPTPKIAMESSNIHKKVKHLLELAKMASVLDTQHPSERP